jgi:hypothetical protein
LVNRQSLDPRSFARGSKSRVYIYIYECGVTFSQSLYDPNSRKCFVHFEKPNFKVESKLGDPKLGGVSDPKFLELGL